jgi:hypothetical protein
VAEEQFAKTVECCPHMEQEMNRRSRMNIVMLLLVSVAVLSGSGLSIQTVLATTTASPRTEVGKLYAVVIAVVCVSGLPLYLTV